jgi:hypothetical protein
MDTITITAVVIDHEPAELLIDGATIPVVVGFNPDGSFQTAADLALRQRIAPDDCDHAGAYWSSNLDMRCPRCGIPLFLPPRYLANRAWPEIGVMHQLWETAGWPEWNGLAWNIIPTKWKIYEHPLFIHCGGLPVRNDREEKYYDALLDLAEDDYEVTS